MNVEKQSECLIQSCDEEYLDYLEIQITDSCNLNCKGCSHLAGLFPSDQHISLEHFKKDLCRLKELFFSIKKIRLLGGEPFLIPNLSEYCKIVRNLYTESDIRIVTNGLLCLKYDDAFYTKIHDLRIGIDVSLYPPTENIIDRLDDKFRSKGINFRFTEPILKFAKRIDLHGNSNIHDTFWNCDSKWCSFLRDGFLYICPAPFFLSKLSQHYNFVVNVEKGMINIHETPLIPAQIKEFLNNPNEVCKYCTEIEFFDWESNKEPSLLDWIVEKGETNNATEE